MVPGCQSSGNTDKAAFLSTRIFLLHLVQKYKEDAGTWRKVFWLRSTRVQVQGLEHWPNESVANGFAVDQTIKCLVTVGLGLIFPLTTASTNI